MQLIDSHELEVPQEPAKLSLSGEDPGESMMGPQTISKVLHGAKSMHELCPRCSQGYIHFITLAAYKVGEYDGRALPNLCQSRHQSRVHVTRIESKRTGSSFLRRVAVIGCYFDVSKSRSRPQKLLQCCPLVLRQSLEHGMLTKTTQTSLFKPTLVGYTKTAVALGFSSNSLSKGTYLRVKSYKGFKSIDSHVLDI